MNLAIVLGVSEYKTQQSLPFCKNDAKYIFNLLQTSKKFDDILYLNENTDSNSIMDSIDDFFEKYSSTKINELLLYFSGHGYYSRDEFYFCTSNFDISSINSTSISNTDIDRVVREMHPETYVKIIDACESGTSYIKDSINRKQILEKETTSFKNCYFFSSSSYLQSSYGNNVLNISDFTKVFLDIIKQLMITNKNKNIKYRQVSGALSDEFNKNDRQTPFFVQQGTLAELFLSENDELVAFLNGLDLNACINDSVKSDEDDGKNNIQQIVKLIPSKDDAQKVKEKFIKKLSEYLKENIFPLLNKYDYKQSIVNINSDDILNRDKIGNWLFENKDRHLVFASEIYTRKLSKNSILNISAALFNDEDAEYEISSFKLNVNENDSIYKIELASENHLPKYCCQLVIMYSLTKIYLFYDFTYSYPKNWDEYSKYNASEKVNIATLDIKDSKNLTLNVEKIIQEFQKYSIEHLEKYLEILFEE